MTRNDAEEKQVAGPETQYSTLPEVAGPSIHHPIGTGASSYGSEHIPGYGSGIAPPQTPFQNVVSPMTPSAHPSFSPFHPTPPPGRLMSPWTPAAGPFGSPTTAPPPPYASNTELPTLHSTPSQQQQQQHQHADPFQPNPFASPADPSRPSTSHQTNPFSDPAQPLPPPAAHQLPPQYSHQQHHYAGPQEPMQVGPSGMLWDGGPSDEMERRRNRRKCMWIIVAIIFLSLVGVVAGVAWFFLRKKLHDDDPPPRLR